MWQASFCIILFTRYCVYSQNQNNVDQAIKNIFSNDFFKNYEEVTPAPLESLGALPKCGEGDQENKYVCVPYYNCDSTTNTVRQGSPSTASRIYIDIRAGAGLCSHYLDVCCQIGTNTVTQTTTRTTTTEAPRQETTPMEPIIGRAIKIGDQNACGIRNAEGVNFTITGNTDNEAEFGEFPWMVAVLRQNEKNCGGSLITPNVVLTAAHCVEDYTSSPSSLTVRAGEWDTQTVKEPFPHQERNVKKVIIHEGFVSGNLHNGIALLILEKSFTKTPTIGTICLPNQNYKFRSGSCFATGWGKDVFGQFGRYSAILKKIQLPLVEKNKCEEMLKKTRLGNSFKIHESFICAGGEAGVDTCSGDGGSPLVCRDSGSRNRYLQVGIVAWGIGCGENRIPGVYIDVSHFRNWIDEKLKQENLSSNAYSVI